MGKDQSGGFHPPKGKPSAVNKVEGLGKPNTSADNLEEFLERDEEYVQDDMTIDASVQVRHPNRNPSKGENSFKGKENKPASNKTIELATEERAETEPEELPQILDKELFVELANYRSNCCITVYIATHKAGVAVNEKKDVIVFKNTLQDLAKTLAEKEIPTAVIEQMLSPGYDLLTNDAFWASMDNGLAVFISEGYFKYIKMPVAPESDITCEKKFFVSPLIRVMARKEYFYLLVISKQKCKLFRADAFGMEYVPVPDLPEDIMDIKRLSEKDASTVRIGTSSGTGGANFHGMGGGNPDEKANIATYFEYVDDILFKQILHTENVPLLLAGVEYLIPIYKSVCDYHNVCSESITGSHEHDDKNALYELAKQTMENYFRQPLQKALTIYANQSATELTSSVPADIIPAAHYGRLSHIFVKKASHIWGTFDEDSSEINLNDQDPNAEDLLDQALVRTFQNGGDVFVLDEEDMPAQSAVAAIFRY